MSSREQVKSLLLPRRSPVVAASRAGSARLSVGVRVHGTAAATRALTRPGWLLFHLIVWALAVTFVGLGRWQLDVSNAKHFDFFNFQYALQWWLFAAFDLFVWVRVMQHRLHPPQPAPAGGGIVLASDSATTTRQGSTLLVAPSTTSSDTPVIYRGYVVPQSSRSPVRSHGDTVHDAYNDYLWQIAAADGETPDIHAQTLSPVDELGGEEGDQRPAGHELR